MICDEAGVSRSSFYRLFHDKYDVMNYFFRKHCEKLILKNHHPCQCRDFMLEYANLILKYEEYFRSAFLYTGQNSFYAYLYESGVSYFSALIQARTKAPLSSSLSMKIRIYTAGVIFITEKWLNDSDRISPSELVSVTYESMPQEMLQYFTPPRKNE